MINQWGKIEYNIWERERERERERILAKCVLLTEFVKGTC